MKINFQLDWFRREVLVKEPEKLGDGPIDLTPKEFSVRTTVQEYGGGAFMISGDTIVFSNFEDQRLYKQSINPNGRPNCDLCFKLN